MSSLQHTAPIMEGQPHQFFLFLTETIQLFALNDHRTLLTITTSGADNGMILLEKGRIIHAQTDHLEGELALFTILRWEQGEINQHKTEDPYPQTIHSELSMVLLNSYDYVMAHGSIAPTPRPTLEEPTSSMNGAQKTSQDLKSIEYFRLIWKETLQNEMVTMDGFISFQIMTENPDDPNIIYPEDSADPLATNIYQALAQSDLQNEHVELHLNLATTYQMFLQMPDKRHLLHVVFDRQQITPAMLQFTIKQLISKLDS